jgi:hypothetical protein
MQEPMQLDIFADSRDVMLRSDVVAAFRVRDGLLVRRALDAFAAEFPHDSLLAPLSALLDALLSAPPACPDHQAAADTYQRMETVVVPVAVRVFGERDASDWLAPLWRSLAHAAAFLPYDHQIPSAYAAPMLLRARDWTMAEEAIAKIPSWRRAPTPLAWMAEARFARGGIEAAWPLLIELSWLNASNFGELARHLDSRVLDRLLRNFQSAIAAEGDTELAWFAAWLLIAEPATVAILRQTQQGQDSSPEHTARLIADLLGLERQGRHAEVLELRRKLRDLHAELFALYMLSR